MFFMSRHKKWLFMSRPKNDVLRSFSKVAEGLSLKLIELHMSCSKQNDRCALLEGLFIVNHLDETVNA